MIIERMRTGQGFGKDLIHQKMNELLIERSVTCDFIHAGSYKIMENLNSNFKEGPDSTLAHFNSANGDNPVNMTKASEEFTIDLCSPSDKTVEIL